MSQTDTNQIVFTTFNDDIAVIKMDDGKANALSYEMIKQLNEAFSESEKNAKAIAFLGRDGKFSAGFDLSIMMSSIDAAKDLTKQGCQLIVNMLECKIPIVAGSTGHALAMGSLMLCASNFRYGLNGSFKYGLNEVQIGLPVPELFSLVAQSRLNQPYTNRSLQLGEIFTPQIAKSAGYLDELVDGDLETITQITTQKAKELAESINQSAYLKTKSIVFGNFIESVKQSISTIDQLFE